MTYAILIFLMLMCFVGVCRMLTADHENHMNAGGIVMIACVAALGFCSLVFAVNGVMP